jgi:hypothetical protein
MVTSSLCLDLALTARYASPPSVYDFDEQSLEIICNHIHVNANGIITATASCLLKAVTSWSLDVGVVSS